MQVIEKKGERGMSLVVKYDWREREAKARENRREFSRYRREMHREGYLVKV